MVLLNSVIFNYLKKDIRGENIFITYYTSEKTLM